MRYITSVACFVLATALTCSCYGDAKSNLVRNSSFELTNELGVPLHWSAPNNPEHISLDATDAPDGRLRLHFKLDGAETMLGQSQYQQLSPGKTYTLSAYIRTSNVDQPDKFRVQLINLGWSFSAPLIITEATADWKRYSTTFVVPAADARPYNGMPNTLYKVITYAKDVRGDVWIDAIQLEQGGQPTDYLPMEDPSEKIAEPSADQKVLNVLPNSSFEMINERGVPLHWGAPHSPGNMLLETTNVPDGRMRLRFKLDGKETMLDQAQYLQLSPSKTYTLSAYIRTRNVDHPDKFQVQLINLGWSFSVPLIITETTADWKRYSTTFVVPAADARPYNGMPNTSYKVVAYAKDVRGDVWIDALQLEQGEKPTSYLPMEGSSKKSSDPISDEMILNLKRGMAEPTFFEIANPLFEELLGDEPGPKRLLYYGYEDMYADSKRAYHKKFALRYVQEEEYESLRALPVAPMTNAWKRGGVGRYPVMRMILRFDEKDVAPAVFGDNPWVLDPRYQKASLEKTKWLAEESLDESPDNIWGNTFGLWTGDEVYGSFAVLVPPPDKRDAVIDACDEEIRREFGFGRFGMPKSQADNNPFARIAYRRWGNAKLVELYRKQFKIIKDINPKLIILGPDPAGMVPPLDYEAMTPYLDLMAAQTWQSSRAHTLRLMTGCDTKAIADLSACPLWSLVQHANVDTPEMIREQYSQVFRNGGEGIVLLGVDWYDRELEHVKLINAPKWRAMLEVVNTVTTMNKVKTPTPDCAMLYASDTYLTFEVPKMANADNPQMQAAYAALGPGVGSWFKFVSDRQIARGEISLGDYKLLYIPLATYGRIEVVESIEQFVKGGGTVVCTQPRAFTWNINGSSLASAWDQVLGVERGESRPGNTKVKLNRAEFMNADPPAQVLLPGDAVAITVTDPAVRVVATFDDGAPAVTVRRLGKGRVVYFAADAFASNQKNTALEKFIEIIQTSLATKVKRDIWRFKLPPFKTVDIDDAPRGTCLTNNHVTMVEGKVVDRHNLATGVTYSYSAPPTNVPDDKTRLIDRKQGYKSRMRGGERGPLTVDDWIVSWTDRQAVTVTFDLQNPYALGHATVFFSGELPDVQIEGSNDESNWVRIGSLSSQAPTEDVIDVTSPLDGEHRYVRLHLGGRKTESPLQLVEIELWSE